MIPIARRREATQHVIHDDLKAIYDGCLAIKVGSQKSFTIPSRYENPQACRRAMNSWLERALDRLGINDRWYSLSIKQDTPDVVTVFCNDA